MALSWALGCHRQGLPYTATYMEGTLSTHYAQAHGAHRPVRTSERQHGQTEDKARGRAKGQVVPDRWGPLFPAGGACHTVKGTSLKRYFVLGSGCGKNGKPETRPS